MREKVMLALAWKKVELAEILDQQFAAYGANDAGCLRNGKMAECKKQREIALLEAVLLKLEAEGGN